MKVINAKEVLGRAKVPDRDGTRLAEHIIEQRVSVIDGLTIDMTGMSATSLVSSFVNAVLHRLRRENVERSVLRTIVWKANYPSEAAKLQEIAGMFADLPTEDAPIPTDETTRAANARRRDHH